MNEPNFKCEFCKKVAVPEANMICDACAEHEIEAAERDEQYAEWHHEQMRIRYRGAKVFDNEVGTISVVYHNKVLRSWSYSILNLHLSEPAQARAKIEAVAYLDGWLDAMAAFKDVVGGLGK